MRALIASGTGRYADPWHPFADTSPQLTAVLSAAGFEVEIDDVDAAIARSGDADLLVVNAGDPWRGSAAATAVPDDALRTALERGIGILALHSAVASLRDYPEWAAAIGAMWVPGLSHHPPADVCRIRARDDAPLRVDDFELFDERYCRLQRLARFDVVAEHDGPDGPEPTAWVRTHGAARIAVDVLGHDTRSYDSAGHRAMLTALARWAARADGDG